MELIEPPQFLYHGTTTDAFEKIVKSSAILKMQRHHVHMQAEFQKAWSSAARWKLTPVVLKIDAKEMYQQDYTFGKTENDVWCTEQVPVEFIIEKIYTSRENWS